MLLRSLKASVSRAVLQNVIHKQPKKHFASSAVDTPTQEEAQHPLIFKQLFDHTSYTYSYLLGCLETKHAILIDPVYEMVERDIKYIDELGLELLFAINTHVHADHVTGSGHICQKVDGCKSVISKQSEATANVLVQDEENIVFGRQTLKCRSTPGHTAGCMTYILTSHKMAFTGDALLIRGCGRTDFQQGNPFTLHDSIHNTILSLPKDYTIYPGHDYKGFTSTTVQEELDHNPRAALSKDNFVTFMRELNLAYPKLIDKAVPANLQCGMYSKAALDGTEEIISRLK